MIHVLLAGCFVLWGYAFYRLGRADGRREHGSLVSKLLKTIEAAHDQVTELRRLLVLSKRIAPESEDDG